MKARTTPKKKTAPKLRIAGSKSQKPTVTTGRQLDRMTTDVLNHLYGNNEPPVLFCRGRSLARIRWNADGNPFIDPINLDSMRCRMAEVIDFFRYDIKGEEHDTKPPRDLISNTLAVGDWDFAPLVGITEAPFVRPDGSICMSPGYDVATGMHYESSGLTVEPVPDEPTSDEREAAKDILLEPIRDLPFVSNADRANAVAVMTSLIYSAAYDGQTPMAVIDKPVMRTGASLLAKIAGIIGTGREAMMTPYPGDDEEMRKKITALLRDGAKLIVFDNVEQKIRSPSLALALTTKTWTDRWLGKSITIDAPQQAVWIVTGINVKLGGDLPPRCYWIQMDPKVSDPWKRTGFAHPNLIEWAKAERGRLVWATLTLARGWFAADCPEPPGPLLGGFEEWHRVVGGILDYSGIEGFLGNADDMIAEADDDGPRWQAFLEGWFDQFGEEPRTCAQVEGDVGGQGKEDDYVVAPKLRELIHEVPHDGLADSLVNKGQSFPRRLGKALRTVEGRRFGERNIRVKRHGTANGGIVKWCVLIDKGR